MNGVEAAASPDAPQEGIVVVVHRHGRFLIIRRAAGVPAGGAWCFVGGAIKLGETQRQAVVREFAEEVGGQARPQRKIWEYRQSDGKLLLHWWLAEMGPAPLQPNHLEVAEIRWCTPAEIEALPDVLESNVCFVREVGRAVLKGARRGLAGGGPIIC